MSFMYYKALGFNATWKPGGKAVPKKWDDYPVKGANHIGSHSKEIDPNSFFGEGGKLSVFMNKAPGLNAGAGMHDVWQVELQRAMGRAARNYLNYAGMLPAAALTFVALLDPLVPTIIIMNNEEVSI